MFASLSWGESSIPPAGIKDHKSKSPDPIYQVAELAQLVRASDFYVCISLE